MKHSIVFVVSVSQYTLSQGGLQPQWWALQDTLNDFFICWQELSEYVGLQNIE